MCVCACLHIRVRWCACSSECSEGEWSALWTSDSGLEKERGSSQESWVTLPGLDELHSSSLEDVPELSLPPE